MQSNTQNVSDKHWKEKTTDIIPNQQKKKKIGKTEKASLLLPKNDSEITTSEPPIKVHVLL